MAYTLENLKEDVKRIRKEKSRLKRFKELFSGPSIKEKVYNNILITRAYEPKGWAILNEEATKKDLVYQYLIGLKDSDTNFAALENLESRSMNEEEYTMWYYQAVQSMNKNLQVLVVPTTLFYEIDKNDQGNYRIFEAPAVYEEKGSYINIRASPVIFNFISETWAYHNRLPLKDGTKLVISYKEFYDPGICGKPCPPTETDLFNRARSRTRIELLDIRRVERKVVEADIKNEEVRTAELSV